MRKGRVSQIKIREVDNGGVAKTERQGVVGREGTRKGSSWSERRTRRDRGRETRWRGRRRAIRNESLKEKKIKKNKKGSK